MVELILGVVGGLVLLWFAVYVALSLPTAMTYYSELIRERQRQWKNRR